jgi:hypothetical protein
MPFKSKAKDAIGTSGSPSILSDTVSAGTTHTIIGLSIANVVSTSITISAKLNKNGAASCFLVKDATVLPGGAIVIVGGDQKVVLEAGDTITAYASAANSADAVMSYLG